MATQILMPALSPTMEEGTLAKWLVKEGDSVSSGQVIAEIETDKATMEFEAADEGRVGKILVDEGTEGVKVNTPIAVLVEEGEEVRPSGGRGAAAGQGAGNRGARGQGSGVAGTAGRAVAGAAGGTAFRNQTVREALRDAMAEEMRRDGDVFLIGEEVAEYQGAYKISQGLLDEFGPRRVIDTRSPSTASPGSRSAPPSPAAADRRVHDVQLRAAGDRPDHQLGGEDALHVGGQMGAPIVFRGPNGAAARVAAQHSHDFAAIYAQIPGLKVVQPYSAADAKGLLVGDPRSQPGGVPRERDPLRAQLPGSRGRGLHRADRQGARRARRRRRDAGELRHRHEPTLQAAEALAADGIEAEVIDLRSLRPMDTEAVLASVRKTNRCVTVEEGFPVCSIGNHLSAVIMEKAFDYLDAPVLNCTGKDVPMPYAANLEKLALVTVPEIVAACKAVTYR